MPADVATVSVVFTLNNLVAFTLWTLVADALARLLLDEANARHLNRFFGGLLGLVGFWMLFSLMISRGKVEEVFSIPKSTSFKIGFLSICSGTTQSQTQFHPPPVPVFWPGLGKAAYSSSNMCRCTCLVLYTIVLMTADGGHLRHEPDPSQKSLEIASWRRS